MSRHKNRFTETAGNSGGRETLLPKLDYADCARVIPERMIIDDAPFTAIVSFLAAIYSIGKPSVRSRLA
jgi:hypothetical protein